MPTDIDRLILRMPSADRAAAEGLAAAVAERLAEQSLRQGGELDRVEVRVPWPGESDPRRLADAVAAAVAAAIDRAT